MTKVAIALFVKNEYSDIAGWIAWYKAFGADTLFIFDDYSTDGTFEIIKVAAQLYNIQIFQTNPIEQPNFYWRQRDAFMRAAQMAKGKYDWLGFFDADEYVYLNNYDTFSDFLDQFPYADGVAMNWCVYGNSNKIIRSKGVVVESFLEHSDLFFGDNQQVKSFIRPEKLGSSYINPHQYDIDPARYVDVKGKVVEWRGSNKDVEWDGAKVMHYICRSMEQYVGRIKKRTSDLGESIRHWHQYGFHFDNVLIDKEPLRMMPKVRKHLFKIDQLLVQYTLEEIRTKPFLEALSFYSAEYEKIQIDTKDYTLYKRLKDKLDIQDIQPIVMDLINENCNNYQLYVSISQQKLIQATKLEAEVKAFLPVYGVIFPNLPNILVLTVLFDQTYYPISFVIEGQHLLSLEHYFYVIFDKEKQKYSLYSIYDNKQLGVAQQNSKSVGLYDVIEQKPISYFWNIHLTYQKLNESKDSFLINSQTKLKDLYSFFKLIQPGQIREFIRIVANLNVYEKEKLKRLFPGILDHFL